MFQIVVLIKRRDCIPLGGNILFPGNLVCILFVSSERFGTFQLDLETLTQVSKVTLWHPRNSKFGTPAYAQMAITSYYILFGTKYSRMDPVKFVEGSL